MRRCVTWPVRVRSCGGEQTLVTPWRDKPLDGFAERPNHVGGFQRPDTALVRPSEAGHGGPVYPVHTSDSVEVEAPKGGCFVHLFPGAVLMVSRRGSRQALQSPAELDTGNLAIPAFNKVVSPTRGRSYQK